MGAACAQGRAALRPVLLVAAELARVQDRPNDAVGHLEACVALDGAADLTDEERAAIRKAREMLKNLDPARSAYEKMVEGYVKRMTALAERSVKDPRLAKECWRHIHLVRPDDPIAKRHAAGVGVAGEDGTVLFNGKSLEGWSAGPPQWTVRDGVMIGNAPDSAAVNRCLHEVKGDFTFTVEARVVTNLGKNPVFGILFGVRGSYDHFGLWIWPESWRFGHKTGEHKTDELHRRLFRSSGSKNYKPSKFNLYRIEVRGKRVTAFVNDLKIWSTSGAVRSLDGFVGFWVQERKVEVRRVVLKRE